MWIAMYSVHSWYILVSIWTLLSSCTCCPQLLQQAIALTWLCYCFYLLRRRGKSVAVQVNGNPEMFSLPMPGKHLPLENGREDGCWNYVRSWDIQVPYPKSYSFWNTIDWHSEHMTGVINSHVIFFLSLAHWLVLGKVSHQVWEIFYPSFLTCKNGDTDKHLLLEGSLLGSVGFSDSCL